MAMRTASTQDDLRRFNRAVTSKQKSRESETGDQCPFPHGSVRQRAAEYMEFGVPDPAVFAVQRLGAGVVDGG